MPRMAVEDNSRMSLRIRPEEKALLLRAVALDQTDFTEFVIRNALRAARAVIEKAERQPITERDSLWVLDLLENPPAPNAKLRAGATAFRSCLIPRFNQIQNQKRRELLLPHSKVVVHSRLNRI